MSTPTTGPGWGIATPHVLASRAGAEVLAAGGSAVDAALAAASVLTVVYPHQCTIGGDAFALVAAPDGVHAVNGSGRAPQGVDAEALRRAGSSMPVSGALCVTVPGVLSAWQEMASRWGTLPLGRALATAADLAADGVPVAPGLRRDLEAEQELLARDPGSAATFLPGGELLREGQVLRQPQLAATLRTLAQDGVGAFYDGELGASVADFLSAGGSAMTREDLRAHRTETGTAVSTVFAGVEHLSTGWNSQGTFYLEGLAALEVLATRRGAPLDALGADAGAVARVLSAAASHRDALLGDPDRAGLAVEELLGAEHAARLADWADRADGADGSGAPFPAVRATGAPSTAGRRSGDTVAVVAADGRGGWVSLIQSAFHAFGAAVVDPVTGVLLHNRGASFSLQPGSPNEVGPRRRPLHTLMPVLTRSGGVVTGAHGTMGGRAQHQIHTHLALRLAAGASVEDAVSAPRWVLGRMEAGSATQDADRSASVEAGVPEPARRALAAAGLPAHELPDHSDAVGHSQLVRSSGGGTAAATDPRADGAALTGPLTPPTPVSSR